MLTSVGQFRPLALLPKKNACNDIPTETFTLSARVRGAAPGMTLNTATDWKEDGNFVGANQATFSPLTRLDDLPAVLPDNGAEVRETVVLINGIMTDVAIQASDMQCLANTGRRVIGIHNATKGLIRDLAQCLGDKLDLKMANNRAVDTTAQLMTQTIEEGKSLHFVGHSQGGLVISNAVARVRDHLEAQGLSPAEVKSKLSLLRITTLGGASYTYPPGPKYKHCINGFDLVPMAAGMGGVSWLTAGPEDDIHRFAQVDFPADMPTVSSGVSNYFARFVDRTTHGPQNIYIPQFGD